MWPEQIVKNTPERWYLVLDAETDALANRDKDGRCVFGRGICWPRSFQGWLSNESYTLEYPLYFSDSKEDIETLVRIVQSVDLVTGWNIEGFDCDLLDHVAHEVLERSIRWPQRGDLMHLTSQYETQKYGDTGRGIWWALDKVLWTTMGLRKLGKGEDAPNLPEAQLASYGINDVFLENKAFRFARQYGYLINPKGQQRAIELPGWIEPKGSVIYDPNKPKWVPPAADAGQMRELGDLLGDPWPRGGVSQQAWLERQQQTFGQLLTQQWRGRPNKYAARDMIAHLKEQQVPKP